MLPPRYTRRAVASDKHEPSTHKVACNRGRLSRSCARPPPELTHTSPGVAPHVCWILPNMSVRRSVAHPSSTDQPMAVKQTVHAKAYRTITAGCSNNSRDGGRVAFLIGKTCTYHEEHIRVPAARSAPPGCPTLVFPSRLNRLRIGLPKELSGVPGTGVQLRYQDNPLSHRGVSRTLPMKKGGV